MYTLAWVSVSVGNSHKDAPVEVKFYSGKSEPALNVTSETEVAVNATGVDSEVSSLLEHVLIGFLPLPKGSEERSLYPPVNLPIEGRRRAF